MGLERLNAADIRVSIEPQNAAYLAVLDVFDTIDSTNSYLLEKARSGAPSGYVCFAEHQTQGRGRLGRSWYSPHGSNIYCSMLWRFAADSPDISGLSIAVGVIVASVLQQYGISAPIQLKWPNDVLVANRKLAGILLERNNQSGVVIGIGLNVNVQDAQEKNWIDLTEITARPVARNVLAGLLVNALLAKLPVYGAQGLSAFLAEWQQHDMLLNQMVTLHTPEKKITGIMRGISEQGELLLEERAGELRRFCYGEVSVQITF